MAWWGKLIGGTFGFMVGGPIGAMLAGAVGHQFDLGLDKQFSGASIGDQERLQSAFFAATFSVMGYICKADGQVSKGEIRAAQAVMQRMQLSAEQKKAAMELFNQGKQPGFPFEAVMQQFRLECHRRQNLVRLFLEVQIQAALADGELHPAEHKILLQLFDLLGLSSQEFDQLLRLAGWGSAGGRSRSGAGAVGGVSIIEESYALLGVKPAASDAEIKKAYRRLMSQHHPDKLVAKGLPEEMINLATEKTQAIGKAYQALRDARGF
ncbi:MAG: co-chaperone DjlA [Immundisolibacteraceae bacterium]|nr:co-chaperone DjlA [Immundisolibacteraceae bacterium]